MSITNFATGAHHGAFHIKVPRCGTCKHVIELVLSIGYSLSFCGFTQIGLFNAAFLVVTALDLEANNLTDLQRSRWTAAAAAARGTLDIG